MKNYLLAHSPDAAAFTPPGHSPHPHNMRVPPGGVKPGAVMGPPPISPAMVPKPPASAPPGGKVGQSPSMAHQQPPPGASTNPPTPKQAPSPADILAQQQLHQPPPAQQQPDFSLSQTFGPDFMNTVANSLDDGPDLDVSLFQRTDGDLFERELANWFSVPMDPMNLAEDDGGMK
jgi:hypothetical protein